MHVYRLVRGDEILKIKKFILNVWEFRDKVARDAWVSYLLDLVSRMNKTKTMNIITSQSLNSSGDV